MCIMLQDFFYIVIIIIIINAGQPFTNLISQLTNGL